MFRPGNLGHLGRLGLVAASRPGLVAQALAILAKYGAAANLYLPGVGAISGIQAGNWLDSAGGTAATVDNPVGLVVNARGGANLTQATTANKPILRRGLVNQLLYSHDQTNIAWLKTQCTIASGAADPSGGTGARKIVEQSGAITSSFIANFAAKPAASALYTAVSLVAASGRNFAWAQVSDGAGNGVRAFFSLVDGSITLPAFTTGTGFSVPAASAVQVSPGWWLLAVSGKTNAAASAYNYTGISNNGTTMAYTGNGDSGINTFGLGVIAGAVTAAQILAAGGIPVTTTAPASFAKGNYWWQFDGNNDNLASTMTPGNAGFICSGATFNDSGVLRTLVGAGAASDASSGVWLARQVSSNLLMLQVGNGTARNSIGAPYPVSTNAVASAGWDASTMFVGINGTETSGAKTVNCTSSNPMNIGVLTGTTNPMLGTIGATIIMPTVLPTATERATLRQFIASLSGVTM